MRRRFARDDSWVLRPSRAARSSARRLRRNAGRKLGGQLAARGARLRARGARLQVRGRRTARARAAFHRLLAVLSLPSRRGIHQDRRDAQRSGWRPAPVRLGRVRPLVHRYLFDVRSRSELHAEQRRSRRDEHLALATDRLVGRGALRRSGRACAGRSEHRFTDVHQDFHRRSDGRKELRLGLLDCGRDRRERCGPSGAASSCSSKRFCAFRQSSRSQTRAE